MSMMHHLPRKKTRVYGSHYRKNSKSPHSLIINIPCMKIQIMLHYIRTLKQNIHAYENMMGERSIYLRRLHNGKLLGAGGGNDRMTPRLVANECE